MMRPVDPEGDARAHYQLCLDPELHTWTGNNVLTSEEAARQELEALAGNPHISVWMIIDNATGELAGRFFLCLEHRCGQRIVGEGNRIAQRFWRKGHNREARGFMFRYAFGVLRADAYETEAWEENINSVRSIEAHGFRFVRSEERMNPKYGKVLVVRHYEMTSEQWQATHQNV